jgi:hypothetical protein
VTTQDKARGMVVAYLDARAVQKRLDEIVGAFNWKNVYSLWQDNSQICGISIFNEERNDWITKFDGAPNSDIEPIKGGLSDSFKRAASAWGIGRYLYEVPSIWVEVEPKGKSYAIKQDQLPRLESEYNAAVSRIFGAAQQQQRQNQFMKQTPAAGNANPTQPTTTPPNDFHVQSVKPSGKSSQVLELVDGNGEVVTAYIKAGDQDIISGSRLRGVQIERKRSEHGDYNLINAYQVAA